MFALNQEKDLTQILPHVQPIEMRLQSVDVRKLGEGQLESYFSASHAAQELDSMLKNNSVNLKSEQKTYVRTHLAKMEKSMKKLMEAYPAVFSKDEITEYKTHIKELKPYFEYAPKWVVLMISLALGIGTMIGWKRIVVTIGSKIGKDHLTYAQGASSELVAASTIGLSTLFKLPVSTTHILSSGIAGTMVASKGLKNLQKKTLKNIALAWILTLPVCVALAFALYHVLKLFLT